MMKSMKKSASHKRKTISKILTLRLTLLIILIFFLLFSGIFTIMRNMIRIDTENQLNALASSYEHEISTWTTKIQAELNQLLITIRTSDFKYDDKALLQYLKDVSLTIDPDLPLGAYVGDDTNRYIDPTDWVMTPDYVVKERGWYKLGSTCDTMTFGDPYVGDNTGKLMVSASGTVEGNTVLSADIPLDYITDVVTSLDIIGDGYAFLFDAKSGYIIAHPDETLSGKKITETNDVLAQEAIKQADNTDNCFEIQENGSTYLVKLNNISQTEWCLATCAKKGVLYQDLNHTTNVFSLLAFIIILITSILIRLQVSVITRPIQQLTSLIQTITNGDFQSFAPVHGNDEITTMTEALNDFISHMQQTIRELNDVSDQLSLEAANSNSVSDIMLDASNNQSTAMQQLNNTVDELARSIEDIANGATSLAQTVSLVNTNGMDAMNVIQETVSVTNMGKNDIDSVSVHMNNIEELMHELDTVVKDVGDSTTEINNITVIIGDIATQTNLLALNASIEAARAGEAGKGFAVVATEIGNLANMSTDAVKKIEDLINKVSHQVDEVVKKTAASVEDVKESSKLVEQTHENFMKIFDKINDTDQLITEVTQKIHDVDDVATNMAAITEEQSASTEMILASSEHLYEHAINIADNSKNVKSTANELKVSSDNIKEHMSHFKI